MSKESKRPNSFETDVIVSILKEQQSKLPDMEEKSLIEVLEYLIQDRLDLIGEFQTLVEEYEDNYEFSGWWIKWGIK